MSCPRCSRNAARPRKLREPRRRRPQGSPRQIICGDLHVFADDLAHPQLVDEDHCRDRKRRRQNDAQPAEDHAQGHQRNSIRIMGAIADITKDLMIVLVEINMQSMIEDPLDDAKAGRAFAPRPLQRSRASLDEAWRAPAGAEAEDFMSRFSDVVAAGSSIDPMPLPVVDWRRIGAKAPKVLDIAYGGPNAELPQADAAVITWTAAEWSALDHVFLNSNGTRLPARATGRTAGISTPARRRRSRRRPWRQSRHPPPSRRQPRRPPPPCWSRTPRSPSRRGRRRPCGASMPWSRSRPRAGR